MAAHSVQERDNMSCACMLHYDSKGKLHSYLNLATMEAASSAASGAFSMSSVPVKGTIFFTCGGSGIELLQARTTKLAASVWSRVEVLQNQMSTMVAIDCRPVCNLCLNMLGAHARIESKGWDIV